MPNTARLARQALLIMALCFFAASTASANAGTWIFFPAIIHQFIGNAVIGLLEALFLRLIFKAPAHFGIIVLGNYVSSLPGILVAFPFSVTPYPSGLIMALAVLFVITVLVEWPFVAWSLKEKFLGFSRKTLKYSFFAQCISYLLLVPLYFALFDDGRSVIAQDVLMADLRNLSANAYQYRIRSSELEGGGSYVGYEIPSSLMSDDFGVCTAHVIHPDTVQFKATWIEDSTTTVSVRIGPDGKLVETSWRYSGGFR